MSLKQGVQGDRVPLHNAARVKIDFRVFSLLGLDKNEKMWYS